MQRLLMTLLLFFPLFGQEEIVLDEVTSEEEIVLEEVSTSGEILLEEVSTGPDSIVVEEIFGDTVAITDSWQPPETPWPCGLSSRRRQLHACR